MNLGSTQLGANKSRISTVSKIIGQAPIQPDPQTPQQQVASNTVPPQHNTPEVGIIPQQVPPSKVQRALLQWAQQTQRNGIRVTQPMLRREAANLAAMAWTERTPLNPSGIWDLSALLSLLN